MTDAEGGASETPDGIRVGVLGSGAITQTVHLPILSRLEGATVVALSDTNRRKAETVAGRFAIARVMTDDEIFEDPEIDALVVSTPNHLHQEQAIAGLEAGKHVLVERPLAFDGPAVEAVIEAARQAGRSLTVGMGHRYWPDVIALRSFVGGGELGELHTVRGAWLNRTMPLARVTWRQKLEESGGGALMDLGVQVLDLCFWLTDYPEAERVVARIHPGEYEVEDAAVVTVMAEGGLTFQVEVSTSYFADEDRHFVRVMGNEGSGALPPLEVQKQLGGRPMDVTPIHPDEVHRENPYTSAYRRQLDHFIRSAAGEAESPLPEEQIRLMTLIQAAYRSAEEEKEVVL
ncbi:MAG: Gfo/Idh/MocA family protein [Longimicrobiales bacterium]